MSTRKLFTGIGLMVAVAITATVLFIYFTQVQKEEVFFEPAGQTVIVSTEDIPANELLGPLVDKGIFVEISIPAKMLVEGAVTDIRQLASGKTVTRILANEQIPISRFVLYEGP